MDKAEILRKFRFYQQAPAAFRTEVEAAVRAVALPAGALFYEAGGECPAFALVSTGNLRVFKVGETGREITLYHVQAGETCLVNMLAVFLNTAPPASAVAETPVEALIAPAAAFRDWVHRSDTVRAHVFETIAARLVDLMTLIEEVAFRRMDARLADFLCRRFGELATSGAVLHATHETIAAELGTAREVVTRLLSEFQRIGAIEVGRGRVGLRDVDRLAELRQGTR